MSSTDELADEGDRILRERARARLAEVAAKIVESSKASLDSDAVMRVVDRIIDERLARIGPRRHTDEEIDQIVNGAFDEVTRDPQQGLSTILRELHRKRKP